MDTVSEFYKLPTLEEIAKLASLNDDDARNLVNCSNPFGFPD